LPNCFEVGKKFSEKEGWHIVIKHMYLYLKICTYVLEKYMSLKICNHMS